MGECTAGGYNRLLGELFVKRLPDGGVIAAQITSETD